MTRISCEVVASSVANDGLTELATTVYARRQEDAGVACMTELPVSEDVSLGKVLDQGYDLEATLDGRAVFVSADTSKLPLARRSARGIGNELLSRMSHSENLPPLTQEEISAWLVVNEADPNIRKNTLLALLNESFPSLRGSEIIAYFAIHLSLGRTISTSLFGQLVEVNAVAPADEGDLSGDREPRNPIAPNSELRAELARV